MAVKFIPYYPDPVIGQAVLDNFVRTKRLLRYRDADRVEERLARGMPLYETKCIEKVGEKPLAPRFSSFNTSIRYAIIGMLRCVSEILPN